MSRHQRRLNADDGAFPRRFGSHLRDLRLARGITQDDLTGRGVARSMVAKIETGERWPSVDAVFQFARVLRVSPQSLVDAGVSRRG